MFLVLFTASRLAMAATITDGFEGTSISALWTQSGPGTEVLTTAAAFSGIQSVEFTASPTFPWVADLTHDFGAEQYGSVSVYAQTGVLCCDSAADIEIGNASGAGDIAVLQRLSDGTFEARVNPGPDEIDSVFSSSTPLDWHQLEIVSNANGLSFEFDGTTVFTDPSDTTGFRYVDLQVYGGPGGSEGFDSFSGTTSDATPEPSTWQLFCVGLAGILFWRRRRSVLVKNAGYSRFFGYQALRLADCPNMNKRVGRTLPTGPQ